MSDAFANVLLVASGLALAANLFGVLRSAGGRRGPLSSRDVPDRNVRRVDLFCQSLPDARTAGPEAFFVALSERLTARFGQGVAIHGPFSNYLLWFAALWSRRYAVIELTDDLFRFAKTAQCHQIAQAFVDISTQMGGQARIVGLEGHVIAEGYYDDQWHAFDPDYGVLLRHQGRIVTVEQLLDAPQLAESLYRGNRVGRNDLILPVLEQRRLHRGPIGGHLSPRTARWQRRARVAKWLLPAFGLLVGGVLKRLAGASP